MLKRLFLLWIFSGSLDGFSQTIDSTQALRQFDASKWGELTLRSNAPRFVTGSVEWRLPVSAPDTLRAELLITTTTRRWGVAHARDGYVVRKGNEIEYLDNNHKPFPMCVTVWGWVKWEKRRRGR